MNFSIGKKWLGALLLALLFSACGGGGGASGTPNTTNYTIGGTVAGLTGSVVLQDNSGDDLTVSANGAFTFATPVANGSPYSVSVLTQPTGQTCSVSTGTGTVSGGNVSNVDVTCATNAYTVGGTVSGLTGSVVLQDNSGDDLTVSANGAFTFATPVANGSPYSVSVLTQPSAAMSCSVLNGTGTISLANVSNVAITCALNTYTVGGTVSGLNGSVVLQNNGIDDHTVSVNGPFNFPSAVASGNPYLVSVFSNPASQHCAVSSGAGTIATSNISNVGVACANNQMGGAWQLGIALNLGNSVSTFAGTTARFNQPYGSVSDGTNMYVADAANHTIRKIVIASGVVTTLAGTAGTAGSTDGIGTAARFNRPIGITLIGGNLYVAEMFNHTIRQIVISSGAVTTLAGTAGTSGSVDGIGTAAMFSSPFGITTDGLNLYVTSGKTIRKIVISTGAVTTLAGMVGVTGSNDGIGTGATFNSPYGITTDNTNLYVVDKFNQTIRQIVIASGVVTTLAGQVGVTGQVDGTGTAASFKNATDITTDGSNLYVTDSGNYTIRKIVIATGAVTTLAGTAGAWGDVDGIGAAARFYSSACITTDNTNLYVTDSLRHNIRQIMIASGAVTTLFGTAGIGSADSTGEVDGTGAAAMFNAPNGITTDGINLYVADQSNYNIRQIVIASGAVTTLAGTALVTGSADGTGTAATFNMPTSITTDGSNLYVTDSFNHTIRKIVIATGEVTTIAGAAQGSADGTGTAASFRFPYGITTDGSNLYVADINNHTIRKIAPPSGTLGGMTSANAVVTTLAGTAGITGSADGTGTAASFSSPTSITTDGINLFVTDTGNNTIRQIVIATGAVTTLAGTVGIPGSADGTGTVAAFSSPRRITTDGINLYVTDAANHTIRQIVIASGVVTTLAGTAGAKGSVDGSGTAARFKYPSGITTDGSSLYVTDTSNSTIRRIQ